MNSELIRNHSVSAGARLSCRNNKGDGTGSMEEWREKGLVHIRDTLAQISEQLQSSDNCLNVPCGIPMGFCDLDDAVGSLYKGDLILLGGRPGMGKTSFAVNIAAHVANNTRHAVCFFSLEEERESIVTRMMSAKARIEYRKLRSRGIQSPCEWNSVAHACAKLSEADILIDDTPAIPVSYMKSQLRRVKNLGLVVVDYLQLIRNDEFANDSFSQENGGILRELKMMAAELEVPVMCCAQLSRLEESELYRSPMMTDHKSSFVAAEQNADIALFLRRDDQFTDEPVEHDIAEIIIVKNRGKSLGSVRLGWDGRFMVFHDLDDGCKGKIG